MCIQLLWVRVRFRNDSIYKLFLSNRVADNFLPRYYRSGFVYFRADFRASADRVTIKCWITMFKFANQSKCHRFVLAVFVFAWSRVAFGFKVHSRNSEKFWEWRTLVALSLRTQIHNINVHKHETHEVRKYCYRSSKWLYVSCSRAVFNYFPLVCFRYSDIRIWLQKKYRH